MAIQFIPNQPIRFESAKFDDQACINKDLSAYSILMQRGDKLYFQAKQGCCEPSVACDGDDLGAELITDGNFTAACGVNWTCGAGWTIAASQASFAAGLITAITQSGMALLVGQPYRIEFNIVSNSSGFDVSVFLGGRRVAAIDASETGTQVIYGSSGGTLEFAISLNNDYTSTSTGTFVVTGVSVRRIADCMLFGTSVREFVANGAFTGSSSGWTLGSGWTWNAGDFLRHSTPALNSSVTQVLFGIDNRSDILFTVTISNRTAGSILYNYGNTLMATLSTNAVHSFHYPAYGLDDDEIEFTPSTLFDGDIDTVSASEEWSGWNYDPVAGYCHTPGWANTFNNVNLALNIGTYYKMTIQVDMTAGSLDVYAGGVLQGTITKSGNYTYFFTAINADGEEFVPSSDFDGCILPGYSICGIRNDYQMRLIYENGAGATDWHTSASSSNPIVYTDDYITWKVNTLASVLSGGVLVALPYSCFRVQLKDFCDTGGDVPSTVTSDTIINYKAIHGCTKMIRAWCTGIAFNFNFAGGLLFILQQRYRTLYFNPSYPISGEDYQQSNGTITRNFVQLEKRYEVLFDYMDEYQHDTLSAQINCDNFEVDGVEYLVPFKDYEPDWIERGKRNLAQSRIEIQKRIEGTLFNRNCS